MRRLHAVTLVFAVAAAATACSLTTSAVRYHTLVPTDSPRAPTVSGGTQPLAIVLAPVRLPAQVNQPQWFVRFPDDSVAVLEQDRWTSLPADELRQALLVHLVDRFGATEGQQATGAPAPIRVALEVRRLDAIVGRESRIEGAWTLTSGEPRGRSSRCDWYFREPAGAAGTPALAAAHRRAVGRLGDALGESLQRLSRGEAVSCPARDPD